MNCGEVLKVLMKEQEITQVILSESTGRPIQALNQMLNNKKRVTPESAKQIGEVIGLHPAVIILLQTLDELEELKCK